MKIQYLFACVLPLFFACKNEVRNEAETQPQITIKNTLETSRKDALVTLDAGELAGKFTGLNWAAVKFTDGKNDIPFQANDVDGDGKTDGFALVLDFAAGEEKNITLQPLGKGEKAPVFKKRTQAELSHKINGEWKGREYMGTEFQNVDYLQVPPEHTDHSWFLRYEGPGWESDLVGYRFYLDWRNATDIFGKKTTDMVLQGVGLDGFDSYHEPADWGMDVLKVGKSLGVGALGTWYEDKALRVETTDSLTCRIVENGTQESRIRTMFHGWKVGDVSTDVTSEISIHAGSRMTRHDVTLSQPAPQPLHGYREARERQPVPTRKWHVGATSPPGANRAWQTTTSAWRFCIKKAELQQITEDEHSHVVVLTPTLLPLHQSARI